VAFAVPIEVAMGIAERILAGEDPAPPAFLGVSSVDPTEGPGGALIERVEPGSPAATAGLAPDDLVRAVDDEIVRSADALTRAIRAREPGQQIRLTVIRDEEELELVAELTSA
jgi:putative serine protease PepD